MARLEAGEPDAVAATEDPEDAESGREVAVVVNDVLQGGSRGVRASGATTAGQRDRHREECRNADAAGVSVMHRSDASRIDARV
jgi:hypothetical protein